MQTQTEQASRRPHPDSIQEFVDRCTARWRFEKTGVWLYELALQKCPEELRSRFEQIRIDEKRHEEMLEEVIRRYGADPHELTPAARITQLESEGLVNVVEHEDFKAVIDALLAVELVDHANWELLIKMAHKLGDVDAREKFESALDDETTHLDFLRQNVTSSMLATIER